MGNQFIRRGDKHILNVVASRIESEITPPPVWGSPAPCLMAGPTM